MGAISKDGMDFWCELGRRITRCTDDHGESAFLCQRLSVLIQRYHAGRCLGYLHPNNPRGQNVAVPALVIVFSIIIIIKIIIILLVG